MKISDVFKILIASAIVSILGTAGCASKYLEVKDSERLLKPDDEFDKAVTIIMPEEPKEVPKDEIKVEAPAGEKTPVAKAPPAKAPPKKAPPKITAKKGAKKPPVLSSTEPDIEDKTGFSGRRPLKDPFRVGETVVHDVSYFKISAGQLTLKVNPFAQVNERKAYSFVTQLETYPRFSSMVYAVDDRIVTLMDFDLMVPRVFTLHVKETSQVREARSYFDFDKLEARYWEKKITTKNNEVEEKRQQWEILPWSQNVFSAIFYMRTFAWEDGKEYLFRVADNEENLVFRGRVERRETIDTDAGQFKAIVIKPQIIAKGIFKPVGDIFIWLSDDDRKIVLRIESKIKIGTLVSEIVKYEPGRE